MKNIMGTSEELLVLCDTEAEYAQLMTEFLKRHKELPWEIHTYTDVDTVLRKEQGAGISLLLVAESAYREDLQELKPARMILLNESGLMRFPQMRNINKYQEAEQVLKEILEVYVDIASHQYPRLGKNCHTKLIGIYSPVHRCGQTIFALAMGQLLAKEHRTLYLNFEHYIGVPELLPEGQTRDLADALYFMTAGQDKFRLRLQTMIQHKGPLDYIPPMRSGQNLLAVTAKEWCSFLEKIAGLGEYEYLVLDLGESVQGLFEILRLCGRIYTPTDNDRAARCKLMQYEQMLALYEYEDVQAKTHCFTPLKIRRIPEDLEQYTRGEFGDFVRAQLKEMENI